MKEMIQRVLLINPPGMVYVLPNGKPSSRKHCFPPIGLAYLASVLIEKKMDVYVIDMLAEGYNNETYRKPFVYFGLSTDDLVDRIRAIGPDIIGFSVMFSQKIQEVLNTCDIIKEAYPDIKIVLGGPHPTGAPEEVVSHKSVDYVLVREAEGSFPKLIDAINKKQPLDQVPNLYYKSGGTIRCSCAIKKAAVQGRGWQYYYKHEAGIPLDLDAIPFPAWHLFPMDIYWNADVRLAGSDVVRKKYGCVITSRGCPNACYYCASPLVSGYKGYRVRNDESVLKEIRWLVEEFGVDEILFNDDNFFIHKARAKRLIRKLGQEFPEVLFSVPGGAEVNALDFELIDLMAENNFYRMNLAIESGNQELQDAKIEKKVNVSRIPELVAYLKAKKIETRAMYMIGFPDETRAQIEDTIKLVKRLPVDDFYIAIVTPVRGTVLYDQCVEQDLFIDGYDKNNITFSTGKIKLPDMQPEELEKIRRDVWVAAFRERREGQRSQVDDAAKRFIDVNDYETAGFVKFS